MDLIWDTLTGVGAVIGILTGAFVLWDRMFRFSPTAVVVTKPLIEGGMNMGIYLRLKNPSERPVLITWENGEPGCFRIADDHSTKEIVHAAIGGRRTIAVDPGTERNLGLLQPGDYSEINLDNRIEARIWWRFAQPQVWQRDRRIPVSIPKRSLAIMSSEDYGD